MVNSNFRLEFELTIPRLRKRLPRMRLSIAIRARWRRLVQCIVSRLCLNKLEAWSIRDQMLMDQWWAALEHENREECDRLRKLMNNNWREYREGSANPSTGKPESEIDLDEYGYPLNWPKCPACGRPSLDGHVTCARVECGGM